MGQLAHDMALFAVGRLYEFSLLSWLGMTVLLALIGPVMAAVAQPVLDPVAVVVALRPGRAVAWMLLSTVLLPTVLLGLVLTWVGVPLAVIVLFGAAMLGGVGYLAVALIWGDRLVRAVGASAAPWASMLVGVVALRLLRLIPFVGAGIHSLVVWIGFGAAVAVSWDVARSWHRRRLPDNVQFANEDLIEWHVAPTEDDLPGLGP